MIEINNRLLELIKEKKSLNQISQELNLTNRQIYDRLICLKKENLEFSNKYYYDGNIVYSLNDTVIQANSDKKNKIGIITKGTDTLFKALAIADLHIGSELERLDLLNMIYDYCVKENINIIIIAGDLIDGFFGLSAKKHTSHEEQMEYFIEKYPFDKNILNFACLGNHDIDSLYKTGKDFREILNNSRPDIITLGYGTGAINVKRDKIIVSHFLETEKTNGVTYNNKLILKGHKHKMECICGTNTTLFLPSLSDIILHDNEGFPGAVKMSLTFNNGFFNIGIFEQLIVEKKIYTLNKLKYDLFLDKNVHQSNPIPFEESYDFSEKKKPKILTSSTSKI